MQHNSQGQSHQESHGPKYEIDIEGTLHPWGEPTITTKQIAELGGWDASVGVIEIDRDNNERTLQPDEVVELKPGKGFAKKVSWKRGYTTPSRIELELGMLRGRFPTLAYEPNERWIYLPEHRLPEGWSCGSTPLALQIPTGYPGSPPYGIYVPAGLRFNGQTPTNYTEPASARPPFGPDSWGVFSWKFGAASVPTADPRQGPNLLNFVLTFTARFREGV